SSPRCGQTADAAASVPSSSRASSTGAPRTRTFASPPGRKASPRKTATHAPWGGGTASGADTPLSSGSRLETLTKIPQQDRAADPGQLQEVEGAMDGRQPVIADLQPSGLPDPGQGPFDHPADLAQAAAVRRPLPRQVVLDAPRLEALPVTRRAVLT